MVSVRYSSSTAFAAIGGEGPTNVCLEVRGKVPWISGEAPMSSPLPSNVRLHFSCGGWGSPPFAVARPTIPAGTGRKEGNGISRPLHRNLC